MHREGVAGGEGLVESLVDPIVEILTHRADGVSAEVREVVDGVPSVTSVR